MPVIQDAIIGGIAWEAFSKSLAFYNGEINDFVLRVYIAGQLRALEQLDGVSDEKIDEATDIIEATILDTPANIKEIKNVNEQKEEFNKYIKNKTTIRNITAKNYFEKIVNKGTMNFN